MIVQSVAPLGRPSCWSSLFSESASTACLAALDKMKERAATDAFMSDSSVRGVVKVKVHSQLTTNQTWHHWSTGLSWSTVEGGIT